MKVKLERPPKSDSERIVWTASLPFVLNTSGRKIHRVRYAWTFIRDTESWDVVHYCCGNVGRNGKMSRLVLLSEPPKDGILVVEHQRFHYTMCDFCERYYRKRNRQ